MLKVKEHIYTKLCLISYFFMLANKIAGQSQEQGYGEFSPIWKQKEFIIKYIMQNKQNSQKT